MHIKIKMSNISNENGEVTKICITMIDQESFLNNPFIMTIIHDHINDSNLITGNVINYDVAKLMISMYQEIDVISENNFEEVIDEINLKSVIRDVIRQWKLNN